ncbi:single-stranded-DNA-specific exonuclease RecJ [Catenovulum agarivorans DS-2]|uniref:Single-stranded-DNA-specific exonuclease RecJ n=1 Tax=Catenovulum agarivorans DS-2 TaxID=1328313 RepID=W7QL56_9ALTE|nr:single-stranded-DNA-specific exonuclease RecJ [Catenovulum agarivorans]EWH08873.1 single-stranded-DNA-specific exonuclease RecJ [Catenovulum agarivorans DS-2]
MKIVRRPAPDTSSLPASLNPVLQRILANRDISASELELSLSRLHKPELKGVEQAVEVLYQAIVNDLSIFIIGDFDADGATSTALSVSALKQLGANKVDFLVPNRFDFGYGLSEPIVEIAHQMGAQVLMTVDNGISCIAGVSKAKTLGMQVVVTDHHLPGHQLPNADAIVNPNQPDCPFPSKNIAGVGVAFYLMLALRAHLRKQNYFTANQLKEPNLATLLDLVALGTVADVVPLDDVNRILVQQGINRIKKGHARPGIKALLDIAKRDYRQLVSSDFGFAVGPRLNAAGRLDDMTLGISCLLAPDYTQAMHIASRLDELNQERRAIESSMQIEAINTLSKIQLDDLPYGICLYQNDWHQGVIGILAGRIKERYHRPVIIFAEDNDEVLKGSCRSIPGLHIRDVLERIHTLHPNLIIKFGGHAMAAGLSINKANFDQFKQVFNQTVQELVNPDILTNICLTDGALADHELTIEVAQLLREALPWGQCFEPPVFDDEFTIVQERLLQDKHIKFVLQHQSGIALDAIWFNYNPALWSVNTQQKVRLAFSLDINEFRGQKNIQLMVKTACLVG